MWGTCARVLSPSFSCTAQRHLLSAAADECCVRDSCCVLACVACVARAHAACIARLCGRTPFIHASIAYYVCCVHCVFCCMHGCGGYQRLPCLPQACHDLADLRGVHAVSVHITHVFFLNVATAPPVQCYFNLARLGSQDAECTQHQLACRHCAYAFYRDCGRAGQYGRGMGACNGQPCSARPFTRNSRTDEVVIHAGQLHDAAPLGIAQNLAGHVAHSGVGYHCFLHAICAGPDFKHG